MNNSKRKLILQLAEEAIYSAKGHFKTSDWIGRSIFLYILVPFITSSLTLIFSPPEYVINILSLIGLIFTVLALTNSYSSNQPEAQENMNEHMKIGNAYLSIYKKLREGFHLENLSDTQLKNLAKEVQTLDKKTDKCKITFIGRMLAKHTIAKEVDIAWLYPDN